MDIEKLKKDISLEEFINAYKIPGIGPSLSKKISEKVININTLRNLLEENSLDVVLKEIEGLGTKVSEKVIETLMDLDFFLILEDMESKGFDLFKDENIYELDELASVRNTINQKDLTGIDSIKDLKIVITGTLSLPRKFFETSILKLGGKISSSVSNNTDMLIYSTYDGTSTTKYKAAEKINKNAGYEKVKLLTEKDFNALVRKIELASIK